MVNILDFNKVWQVKENKFFEVQSDWMNGWTKILAFDIDANLKDCDHPGWTFTIELFKLWFFQVTYYDNRHWEMLVEDEKRNNENK